MSKMQDKYFPDVVGSDGRDFGKAVCIITGASKGFGRCIAKEIALLLKPGSMFFLVARSGDKLRELQAELAATRAGKAGLITRCVVADLGLKDDVDQVIREIREAASDIDINQLLLINNAASLGDVSRFAKSFTDLHEVNAYMSFNVSSALSLTASVLEVFPRRQDLRRCVVNISSLCALQPFPSWVLYCTGKAARDMMFKVLAEEEPDLRVLSYAPGPLDTDMLLQARTESGDAGLKKSIAALHSQGEVLTCEESCSKLLKVLLEDEYPSGTHLDYHDV
ncbi:sepiapterin reductase a [Alosa sapidissima]|uniref:sepiapterin reductase a n=1 Tax=Alosa sapidissima TaxID=34773 RepID=UPI001C0A4BD0|nr:sepiapterin reductase a [Alosa sapidissima]XP_041914791.1 sepiapterin reductase a [Alosa sapidissima]